MGVNQFTWGEHPAAYEEKMSQKKFLLGEQFSQGLLHLLQLTC
jgi:hypothetical protein